MKITVDKTKGRQVHFKTVSVSELNAIAETIADAAAGIQEFATRHGFSKGVLDADE